MQPEVFADFLLVQTIAVSHMAETFLAVRLGDRSGRTFVVKRPRLGEAASGAAAQAIAREGEVLSKVRASSIVRLEAAGEIAGLPYVAVEHVRGTPLDVLLDRNGALTRGAAAAIARDLALALAALHDAGFIHGDIAPSNVLVDETGEVQVIDFGLALPIGEAPHALSGKPGYIAPETLHGEKADPAADVYAWGIVVAECLLGRRLFAERDLADAGARAHPPAGLSKIGDAGWVVGALERDPAKRPSARAAAAAIVEGCVDRAMLAGLAAGASAAPESRRTRISTPPAAIAEPAASPEDATRAAVVAPPAAVREGDPRPSRRLWFGWIAGLGASAVLGVVVGRRSTRPTRGRLTVAGWLPPRAELELDGAPIQRTANADFEVEPGEHVLVVRIKGRELREIPFAVRAGENVVLVPVNARIKE